LNFTLKEAVILLLVFKIWLALEFGSFFGLKMHFWRLSCLKTKVEEVLLSFAVAKKKNKETS